MRNSFPRNSFFNCVSQFFFFIIFIFILPLISSFFPSALHFPFLFFHFLFNLWKSLWFFSFLNLVCLRIKSYSFLFPMLVISTPTKFLDFFLSFFLSFSWNVYAFFIYLIIYFVLSFLNSFLYFPKLSTVFYIE